MFPLPENAARQYYANVLAVARADGVLSPAENTVLEAVRKAIGLKKSDVTVASKMAESPGFSPAPAGTWSDQVSNLEAMVALATADGELAETETGPIAAFAGAIGISQEQMDRILADVRQKPAATVPCPACGAPVPQGGRFCPSCGAALPESMQGERVAFDIPPAGVAIEFAETNAPEFPDALAAAATAPLRQTCHRDRRHWHLAAWPEGTVADAMPVLRAVEPLRLKTVWISGKKIPWEEGFQFLDCDAERSHAYNRANYCFGIGDPDREPNPWGCRCIEMPWAEDASWLCLGSWVGKGSRRLWRFDKPRIIHEVTQALRKVSCCPHLHPRLPEIFVSCLPDAVDPFHDPAWTTQESDETNPEALKVRVEDGWQEIEYVFGVAPQSGELFGQLLTKALDRLGI